MVVNGSAGRGVGKLVGRVVAIAGNMRDKENRRVVEVVEEVVKLEEGKYYEDARLVVVEGN